jgi:hypothetical protein
MAGVLSGKVALVTGGSRGIAVMAPINEYRMEDSDRTWAVNVRAISVAAHCIRDSWPSNQRRLTNEYEYNFQRKFNVAS